MSSRAREELEIVPRRLSGVRYSNPTHTFFFALTKNLRKWRAASSK